MGKLIFVKEASELPGGYPISPEPVGPWIGLVTGVVRKAYISKINPNLENLYLFFKGKVISERAMEYLGNNGVEDFVSHIEKGGINSTVAYWCKDDFNSVEPFVKKRKGWSLEALIDNDALYAVHTYSLPR